MGRWTSAEDQALCRAWVALVDNPTVMRGKAAEGYWKEMLEWLQRKHHTKRTIGGLQHRWALLHKQICVFTDCVRRAGGPHADRAVDEAMQRFQVLMTKEFKFVACWKILRSSPTFNQLVSDSRKPMKPHFTDSDRKRRTPVATPSAAVARKAERDSVSKSQSSPKRSHIFAEMYEGDSEEEQDLSPPPRKKPTRPMPMPKTLRVEDWHQASVPRTPQRSTTKRTEQDLCGDNQLARQVRRLADAADEHNKLLETQLGVTLFTQPVPRDSEAGKEYIFLARRYHLNRLRQLCKNLQETKRAATTSSA